MADKRTALSIVIRTVDNATAKIRAISAKLEAATRPTREFREALSGLREKSGLDELGEGFAGVGSTIGDVIGKVAMVGAAVGGAVAGMLALVGEFDSLGDKAESIGVSVDFLAQMRYAAQRSGLEIADLDSGLQSFSKALGQARSGSGKMASFLGKVSPALLTQVKAAKSSEQALDLVANAMAKIEDPAKRAALASVTLGNASFAPLLAKGGAGIKELRDRFADLAGSQEAAASAAGATDDAMIDLKASATGIKAALVEGLAPALTQIIERLRAWFKENRSRVAEFAKDLGKRLPAAFQKLIDIVGGVIKTVRPFIDSSTKIKVALAAVAAVMVGPLVSAIYTMGAAIMSTPLGWIMAAIAAIAAGVYLLIDNWDEIAEFFVSLWGTVKGAFGDAWSWISDNVSSAWSSIISGLEAAWNGVANFFSSLWDGITSVFQRAWDLIKSIVDKVMGAVDSVVGAAKSVSSAASTAYDFVFGDDDEKDMLSQVAGKIVGTAGRTQAHVTVDFANAPRGTRVATDPKSTTQVDLSVGYQMLGAP